MLKDMSNIEWIHWQVYMGLAPFAEERADLRTGHIVATIANLTRDTKQHTLPFDASDFAQRFGDTPEYFAPGPTRTQSAEGFSEVMSGIADTYKKSVK